MKEFFNRILALLIIFLIYFVAEVYVIHTPNPNDDKIPDQIKNQVLHCAEDLDDI